MKTTLKAPAVGGQLAEVLALLRARGSALSLELTADLAIPEAASRICELRDLGYRIRTVREAVDFRGRQRRGVARYILLSPEWIPPGRSPGSETGPTSGKDDPADCGDATDIRSVAAAQKMCNAVPTPGVRHG